MKVYILKDTQGRTLAMYEKKSDAYAASHATNYVADQDVVPASPDLKLWSLWLEWNGRIVQEPAPTYNRSGESTHVYGCNPNVVIFVVLATDSADALTVARRRLNVALDRMAEMFEEGEE